MSEMHVLNFEGSFVGTAVREAGGYRFVSVDVRLDELDGRVWRSLPKLRRRLAFERSAQSWKAAPSRPF